MQSYVKPQFMVAVLKIISDQEFIIPQLFHWSSNKLLLLKYCRVSNTPIIKIIFKVDWKFSIQSIANEQDFSGTKMTNNVLSRAITARLMQLATHPRISKNSLPFIDCDVMLATFSHWAFRVFLMTQLINRSLFSSQLVLVPV